MHLDLDHAASDRSMRSAAERDLSPVHLVSPARGAQMITAPSDNSISIGMANKSSDHLEYMTVEFDEYPHTLDLNTDDIAVVQKEHTVELSQESGSGPTPVTAIDAFRPGCVIRDRYVIEDVVGEGGFAIVYRARDLRRDASDGVDHVALKVLRPELRERSQAIARLKREFMQTHGLLHPNIVRMFDLDAQDNAWFIVMELLAGETLAARLRRLADNPVPLAEAQALLAACADALTFLHQHNVTHGDFKPANVFVLQDGGVRIIDLGSSAELGWCAPDNVPDTRDCVATPAYASPQVLARTMAVPSDDLFSFACVAFELLSGSHPFAGRSCLAMQARNGAVADTAALPPEQIAVLRTGLAWQREDRPSSIREFFHSLTEPVPVDARSDAGSVELRAGLTSADSVTITASEDDPAPIPVACPETLPAEVAQPLISVAPVSTSSPAIPAPSGSAMLACTALPVIHAVAQTPSAPTAEHESQDAMQPPMKPKLSFIRPPKNLVPYYALTTCILLYAGVLLFRSPDAGSPPGQIQSIAPKAELGHTAAAMPAPESAETPQSATAVIGQHTQSTAAPTSTISFDTGSMAVTENAVAAAIILKRVGGGPGPVQVRWSIREGSAEAGRDFGGPTSGIAEFADFQQVRALFVPLINAAARSGDRIFSVELTNTRDVAIAPVRNIRVTILDTNRPAPDVPISTSN